MLSVFCSPSRYVQGRNATAELGDQLKHIGLTGKALIVASDATAALLNAAWQQSFKAAGIEFQRYPFGGECSQAEIDAGTTAGREYEATVVIGAGGGKALDTSRAVAANLDVPAVNCPTIAASDAPCSALSVVYNDDGSVDRYIFYPRNPALVLVDTSIIAAAPRRFLVAGMGDAMATWYEARTVIAAHKPNQLAGRTTITARALAELCCETLYADGVDAAQSADVGAVTPALERIVEANILLSGLGFESGGLAIAHSLHNGLTTAPQTHPYLHGEKVAFGLLVQLVVEGQPNTEIDRVLGFCRAVGLPTNLADVGLTDVDDATIMAIAQRTVAAGETAHNEPFAVTPEMIADGIRLADRLGQ